MELLIISSAVFTFCVFSVLMRAFGIKADKKERRINYVLGKKNEEVFEELELSFFKRFIYPKVNFVLKTLTSKSKKNKAKKNKNDLTEKNLRMAGVFITQQEFDFIRMFVMLSCFLLFGIIAVIVTSQPLFMLLLIVVGAMLGVLIPRYYLIIKTKSRQTSMRRQLPDVLDLISVSIEAGLSFDGAILKISEKLKGPLIDEFLILYREIQMGKPRRDALKSLSECTNIDELKTFASSIIQADQLGIPVKNVLRIQSSQLRITRKQKAQEKGMKAPVKMMIPMLIFIFPVVFIVILGPAIIQFVNSK